MRWICFGYQNLQLAAHALDADETLAWKAGGAVGPAAADFGRNNSSDRYHGLGNVVTVDGLATLNWLSSSALRLYLIDLV